MLEISLKDNGMGRTDRADKTHQSKALSILEKRIIETNLKEKMETAGTFLIMDLKDENDQASGTECIIKLPYFELI